MDWIRPKFFLCASLSLRSSAFPTGKCSCEGLSKQHPKHQANNRPLNKIHGKAQLSSQRPHTIDLLSMTCSEPLPCCCANRTDPNTYKLMKYCSYRSKVSMLDMIASQSGKLFFYSHFSKLTTCEKPVPKERIALGGTFQLVAM